MNMSTTVIPKTDQINADALIGQTLTIKVTRVELKASDEQPCSIYYESDPKRPFKPCKSMRRVLIKVWGEDASTYAGKRMTLYTDPTVMYGALAVGGIRISHMSDMNGPVTMALTATKGNKKPFTVKPLTDEPQDAARKWVTNFLAVLAAATTPEARQALLAKSSTKTNRDGLRANRHDLSAEVEAAIAAAEAPVVVQENAAADEDSIFPGDRPMPEGA